MNRSLLAHLSGLLLLAPTTTGFSVHHASLRGFDVHPNVHRRHAFIGEAFHTPNIAPSNDLSNPKTVVVENRLREESQSESFGMAHFQPLPWINAPGSPLNYPVLSDEGGAEKMQQVPLEPDIASPNVILTALENPRTVLVDMRSPDEIKIAGKVQYKNLAWVNAPGTPFENPGLANGGAAKLLPGSKTDPIIVYCSTGKRAQRAKRILEEQGYKEVLNAGSLEDFQRIF